MGHSNAALKAVREYKGRTQKEAATHLNLSLRSYAAKENGETEFKQSELFALADWLGMTVEELFRP